MTVFVHCYIVLFFCTDIVLFFCTVTMTLPYILLWRFFQRQSSSPSQRYYDGLWSKVMIFYGHSSFACCSDVLILRNTHKETGQILCRFDWTLNLKPDQMKEKHTMLKLQTSWFSVGWDSFLSLDHLLLILVGPNEPAMRDPRAALINFWRPIHDWFPRWAPSSLCLHEVFLSIFYFTFTALGAQSFPFHKVSTAFSVILIKRLLWLHISVQIFFLHHRYFNFLFIHLSLQFGLSMDRVRNGFLPIWTCPINHPSDLLIEIRSAHVQLISDPGPKTWPFSLFTRPAN